MSSNVMWYGMLWPMFHFGHWLLSILVCQNLWFVLWVVMIRGKSWFVLLFCVAYRSKPIGALCFWFLGLIGPHFRVQFVLSGLLVFLCLGHIIWVCVL